ncbi:MAG: tyrosine-type recombinase/integrase [Hyphomicrobiales bacterium]
MAIFNDAMVKALKPQAGKRQEIPDPKVSGLAIRVTSTGVKTWAFRYRNAANRQCRVTLGRYPMISLADARLKAKQLVGDVASNIDPVAERKMEKAKLAAEALRTVDGLAQAYFEDAALGLHRNNAQPKRESTLSGEKWMYEKQIKPFFGDVPLASLTKADIQAFVSKQSRQAPSNGRHCRNILRQFLSYAVRKELVPVNVALDIQVQAVQARDRVLNDDELRAFWSACKAPSEVDGLQLSVEMSIALRLACVTLQRGGEVCGMHTDEIDLDTKLWTIPASRMKTKRVHLVPLSNQAIELIQEAVALNGEGFVFPSPRDKSKHIDRRALSRAMNRMCELLNINNATPHDLRRTGATNLTSERVGIPRFIVSQVLGHSGDTGGGAAITGVYDRNDYLKEKRRALDAWAVRLLEIVEDGNRVENVVSIYSVE